jgi:(-)-germacrene D synthase
MKVGLVTSTYNLLVGASLVLMKSATKEVFDWLVSSPKILVATMVIGRLLNDVTSHKV